jgi:hypothetical protein
MDRTDSTTYVPGRETSQDARALKAFLDRHGTSRHTPLGASQDARAHSGGYRLVAPNRAESIKVPEALLRVLQRAADTLAGQHALTVSRAAQVHDAEQRDAAERRDARPRTLQATRGPGDNQSPLDEALEYLREVLHQVAASRRATGS